MFRRSGFLVLASVGVILATFFAVRPFAIWYWTPLTERSILKLYAIDNDPRNFDVLVLGASIAEFAFYPNEIESELNSALPRSPGWTVYNASIQAAFLPTYLEVLRNVVGRRQRPRAVMLAVSPRDFNGSSNRVQRQVRFFARSPSDFWLVLTKAGNSRQRWSAIQALTHGLEVIFQGPLWPFYRDDVAYFQGAHGRILLDHYPVLRVAMEADARHQISPQYMEELKQVGMKEVKTQQLNDFVINDLIDVWTRAIIAEAKTKKVPLAIVFMPATEWFDRNAFGPEKALALQYIARVCAETNTPLYNLEDPRFRPRDEDFFEGCDHLSYAGAAPLSRAAARFIVAPLLSGTPPAAAPAAPPPAAGKPIPGKMGFGAAPAPASGATPMP